LSVRRTRPRMGSIVSSLSGNTRKCTGWLVSQVGIRSSTSGQKIGRFRHLWYHKVGSGDLIRGLVGKKFCSGRSARTKSPRSRPAVTLRGPRTNRRRGTNPTAPPRHCLPNLRVNRPCSVRRLQLSRGQSKTADGGPVGDGGRSGGFALIASPGVYRVLGVVGVIVDQAKLAAAMRYHAMRGYHLDPTWTLVPH
jgi:hypothetical protein